MSAKEKSLIVIGLLQKVRDTDQERLPGNFPNFGFLLGQVKEFRL